jgi:F0F1-type ATP synthase membrane subunit c/vacuolar-type H+-ATPase subunit K
MPGWLTRPRLIMAIAAAIAVAVGAAGTALALGGAGSPHVAAMSRGGLTRAELKVTSGTAILDITVGRLGGALLRVSVPDGAPVRPVLSGSRLIVLSLDGTAPGGPGAPGPGSGYAVKVVLSPAVTWSLDLAGGTQLTKVDLRGGTVAGIAVMAGSDTLDMSRPGPCRCCWPAG